MLNIWLRVLLIFGFLVAINSCSKSQVVNCSKENSIPSKNFNTSNGMKYQQRHVFSSHSKQDWNTLFLKTGYSCKDILTQFFYCKICCNAKENDLISYSGKILHFEKSISVETFTAQLIEQIGTMQLGSQEYELFHSQFGN